jgi:hypothetical protein
MLNLLAVPEIFRVAVMSSLAQRIEAEPPFPDNQADSLTVSETVGESSEES